MTSLYICYQSIEEPLTRTQVVSYLEGLALAGHSMLLLTFEPKNLTRERTEALRSEFSLRGIEWSWLRYHKRPTLPATTLDVLLGAFTALRLVRKHNIQLIHARGQVAGVVGLIVKALSHAKLLFDMRGLMAEEYADAGVWRRGGYLYRIASRAEALLLRNADGIVVLTRKAIDVIHADELKRQNGVAIEVIPCCVDLRAYAFSTQERATTREALTLVYSGKLGGWYWDEAMVKFFAAMRRAVPDTTLSVFTQSNPQAFVKLLASYGIADHVEIRNVAPQILPLELCAADVGLSFIRPSLSKTVSSPTKIGEYLAAGLPVVSTRGIGDIDEMLTGVSQRNRVGILIDDDSEVGYDRAARDLLDLMDAPGMRVRCRAAARELLDLESVGWPRYRRLYERLA